MSQPGGTAAFFDIDETLIRGATSYYFMRELYRQGFFTGADLAYAARQALLYLVLGENPQRIQRATQRALETMAGHSVAEVRRIGERFADQLFPDRVFTDTQTLLAKHRAAGHEVWLLSTTPQEITDLLAERVGATGSVGTRVCTRADVYLPKLAGPLVHGPRKALTASAIARRRGLDLGSCYAYSDSHSDLPLLRLVGHPRVINPDRQLRKAAQAEGWPIMDLRTSARIWQRYHTPAQRGAYAAGALWAGRKLARRLRGGN